MRVFREKNHNLIPIYTTIINILCSIAWLGYGICINLVSQIVPNVLGFLLSATNAVAWGYYYLHRNQLKKYQKNMEKETEDEMELVEK